MKKEKVYRSPFFYTGDKYKLINELKNYFPKEIDKFIEPFVGGGSVFLNSNAKSFYENDIDKNIMSIHNFLSSFSSTDDLLNILFSKIEEYNFSCSYKGKTVPQELKSKYVKTYFAKHNADSYKKLKEKYNASDRSDIADLYLLLIYGFNRMLRFNQKGEFNLPVGNVDFNQNVVEALTNYVNLTNQKKIYWSNEDYKSFLSKIVTTENDFIYLDPPYLITSSEYNKFWRQKDDDELYSLLDEFTKKKIRFALSNVVTYKDKENIKLLKWAKKYNVYPVKSNYINYHDNSIKSFSEVLITNYD
ncbi:Dam family site-specific DNA-(adenine-N6)-methyltransferase [Treponema succinifaciens]|uniref:Dam family site-specific DNA-(adenine-N6)-methyltransferase n=1 Tax=Treponema succinifaciens TaxID=167 RepID=UPI002597E75B|nr:Dam family site-specific DNA-(adenine-N6)-methyltransferase [uncultured Treponema sp.]